MPLFEVKHNPLMSRALKSDTFKFQYMSILMRGSPLMPSILSISCLSSLCCRCPFHSDRFQNSEVMNLRNNMSGGRTKEYVIHYSFKLWPDDARSQKSTRRAEHSEHTALTSSKSGPLSCFGPYSAFQLRQRNNKN